MNEDIQAQEVGRTFIVENKILSIKNSSLSKITNQILISPSEKSRNVCYLKWKFHSSFKTYAHYKSIY